MCVQEDAPNPIVSAVIDLPWTESVARFYNKSF